VLGVTEHQRNSGVDNSEVALDLSHLRRETRTALELAVVASAPEDLLDRLAWAAGLLEAIVELPSNSPPVLALVPKLSKRARGTLEQWNRWQAERLAKNQA
jgi:hypothetical protein